MKTTFDTTLADLRRNAGLIALCLMGATLIILQLRSIL